jgi:hypothetical protein
MSWDYLFLREWSRWGEEIGKAERLPKDVRAIKIGVVLRSEEYCVLEETSGHRPRGNELP